MIIENKPIYNLYQSVKQRYPNGREGVFIEGFSGGVTVYAVSRYAAYRKTIRGDNQRQFVWHAESWNTKPGYTDTVSFFNNDKTAAERLQKTRSWFNAGPFGSTAIDGSAFFKAAKCADAVNRGEPEHNIVLSLHNGFLDLASWPNDDEFAVWQEVCKASGSINGAVKVNRKRLDILKTKKEIRLAFVKLNNRVMLFATGDIEAVIAPIASESIDRRRFLEVLGYEYQEPETETRVVAKPGRTRQAPKRKPPVPRKENGAFFGWTHNRLGTKQVKVCKW
jgi:hypothetical protein